MKKFKKIAVLILCAAICALACSTLVGCNKNELPEDKGYIVLSFDLQWDKALPIEPIILDGVEEKQMPEDPLRAGYTFVGWYFDKECTEKFEAGVTALTEDTTLYAKWMLNSFEYPERPTVGDPKGLVYAERQSEDGSIYYIVTGYKGEEKDVIIPARYNFCPVNEIADGAFKDCKTVETVSFGVNIDKVGNEAFRNCTALKSITVANGSAYYVSNNGLLYDSRLATLVCAPSAGSVEKVTFGKDLKFINDYALENCTFEVEFDYRSEYKEIEKNDFAGFKGEVKLGKHVIAIRQYAFKDATCEIVWGDCEISEFGVGAFDGYKGKKLTVPSTVKTVTARAFNGCYATVDLSKTGIKRLGAESFAGYLGETLVIPNSVVEIEKNAFYQSTTKITFAEGTAYSTVRTNSFAEFNGEVIFPFTVNKVEANAFRRASAAVTFSKPQRDITLDSGFDNDFKGKFIYG